MVAGAGPARARRRRADLPHLARAAARARARASERLLSKRPRTHVAGFASASDASFRPASSSCSGPTLRVEIVAASTAPETSEPSDRPHAIAQGQRRPPLAATSAQRPAAAAAQRPLGNPKHTFDQFVIGDCNRLAHAAALTVAEMPAQAYNPLFIYGPPGLGKTHLLSSIANYCSPTAPA